jgi:threonine/homoserine/homoserine lactone efflux protein
MIALNNFLLAFILSFAGSIPPGTINLSVVQLGLQNKLKIAIRLALAASVMEYPYAWIAVKFERLITSSPAITDNLTLITAIVLIVLGLINVLPKSKSSSSYLSGFSNSGYRRGLLLGIFNPLAIPYWVGITAYLQNQGWTDLSTSGRLHGYLLGVVAGAFLLLLCLAYLSKKVMQSLDQFPWIQKIPGFLLLALGIYSLVQLAV